VSLTPAIVLSRLAEIEEDLGHRQLAFEEAAEGFYRAKRDFELELATARLDAQGTVQERADRALLSLAKGDTYKRLIISEASYEGAKAAMRTLETRASIGQSILRSQTAGVA
jgi:hypothetical protein